MMRAITKEQRAEHLKRRNRRYYLAHKEKWATVYAENKRRKLARPKHRRWTIREDAILRSFYAEEHNTTITAFIRRSINSIYNRAHLLGLRKSSSYLAEHLSALGSKLAASQSGHRFQRGHVPFNKGRKGFYPRGCESGWFKKGHVPQTHVPVGTTVAATKGYLKIKIAEPNRWRWLHRKVWEDAHGPIATGGVVRFKDGNWRHCELNNLFLTDLAGNMLMNTIHNYPTEITHSMRALAKLRRKIDEKQDRKSA